MISSRSALDLQLSNARHGRALAMGAELGHTGLVAFLGDNGGPVTCNLHVLLLSGGVRRVRRLSVPAEDAVLELAHVGQEVGSLWACTYGEAHQGRGGVFELGVVDRLTVCVGTDLAAFPAGVGIELVRGFGRVDLMYGTRGAYWHTHVAREGLQMDGQVSLQNVDM